jgi:hypothetical protein
LQQEIHIPKRSTFYGIKDTTKVKVCHRQTNRWAGQILNVPGNLGFWGHKYVVVSNLCFYYILEKEISFVISFA